MKIFIKRLSVLSAGLLVLLMVIIGLNYFNSHVNLEAHPSKNSKILGKTVTVFDWNIGYAGLGKDSDFIMDGGTNLKPPSRATVQKNLAGIAHILVENPADYYTFQEISKPDMLTWGVDVLGGVQVALANYSSWFSHDFHTVWIPKKYALKHGLAVFSAQANDDVSILRLPNEPNRLGGIIKRQYHLQVTKFSQGEDRWVLLNIHLSAFDEGGNIRVQQFENLMQIANDFYSDGNHVVIGGDWNMQLVDTDFPNTTKKEYLFWLKKLPHDKIPEGFNLVIDPKVATARTNERSYVKGENYTTIIDGFMVSPNVDVLSITGIDTDFEFTDHQPIKATFKAR